MRWNLWANIPELERVDDEKTRKEVIRWAAGQNQRDWRVMLLAFGVCMLVAMIVVHAPVRLPLLGKLPHAMRLGLTYVIIAPILAFVLRAHYLHRARPKIWARLAEIGVPICLGCGYDTRALASPRCPECGRELGANEQGRQAEGPLN